MTKNEQSKIIHIDMDAFFAAVEVRDNPELAGRPLIIGALPSERGVVATCSYEARAFGVRSAMSIKEAYRRCPDGVYMHPNMEKYKKASEDIHKIWDEYTDLCEYISLDEGFLDVTLTAQTFGGASAVGREIKRRVKDETGLTCSVGLGYSMMSAKLASEENKPDGYFEILTATALRELIIDRNVRIIYGVGAKTAEKLRSMGITTVRHILDNRETVISLMGNQGRQIVALADGVDTRRVTPYTEQKSIGTEHTFQHDITDFNYLKDMLLLIAQKLSFDIRAREIYSRTITLKVTYANMQSITRSVSGEATDKAARIAAIASDMLDKIDRRPVRLVGIYLSGLTSSPNVQLSLFESAADETQDKLNDTVTQLQMKYGRAILKTGRELLAERRVVEDDRVE